MAVVSPAPCWCATPALPALKQAGRGTIVNIASGAALRRSSRTAYRAAKAGLVMFGKTPRWIAADQIRVNAIRPGIIDTRSSVPPDGCG
jgi:NAD(P)-dependent dehydrogenase (short-subunit alcohol dehydrogenase family)